MVFCKKQICFILTTGMVLFGPLFLKSGSCDVSKPEKILVLTFPGACKGLNPLELVKKAYEKSNPFVHSLHIYTPKGSLDFDLLNKLGLFSHDSVILEIILHYPKDMQDFDPIREIAQEAYSSEALELINTAAIETEKIIKNFHKIYPDTSIKAVAIGTSDEILIKALERNISEISNFILYFPTMAMVNGSEFIKVLKDNGYNKDKVTVIAYEGDPTIPKLEKLKTENEELFTFWVIK